MWEDRPNENEKNKADVSRWGLSVEAIANLGNRLRHFWRYYGQWTGTRTHTTSQYGLGYMSGLLRMKSERNRVEIAREAGLSEQNMQHFMSHSPWSGSALIEEVQKGICQRSELAGGILVLDESADEKAGEATAGAGRQHNGRLGKIEQSQVGVYVAYAKEGVWSLWDGDLVVPEKWFSASYAERRAKAEIPVERVFQTKIELGWQMIAHAQAVGLSFVAVAFDSLYGRSHWLREQCEQAPIEYYADIPANYLLYLEEPLLEQPRSKAGKISKTVHVSGQLALKASDLPHLPQTDWQTITLRPQLADDYETDLLPNLSVANVRELLRASLPLRQLSIQEAAALVVKHLDNRTRSRRSRLRTYSEH